MLGVMQSLMSGGREMTDTMTEQYWSRFADTHDGNMEYVVGKPLLDQITQKLNDLPELGDVVELGCGTGYFTKAIGDKSQSIMATDLSDSLLEAARRRLGDCPKVTIQKENCMATSFPAEAFDCVFMANLIHLASIMEDAGFGIRTSNVIGDKTKALYLIGRKDTTA